MKEFIILQTTTETTIEAEDTVEEDTVNGGIAISSIEDINKINSINTSCQELKIQMKDMMNVIKELFYNKKCSKKYQRYKEPHKNKLYRYENSNQMKNIKIEEIEELKKENEETAM